MGTQWNDKRINGRFVRSSASHGPCTMEVCRSGEGIDAFSEIGIVVKSKYIEVRAKAKISSYATLDEAVYAAKTQAEACADQHRWTYSDAKYATCGTHDDAM